MVRFGALLQAAKVESFDKSFQNHFVDYEELKRILDHESDNQLRFQQFLDHEIEKASLFALGRVGFVSEVFSQGGDVAAAREAMLLLLGTLRFVELNLVAIRKIVKKRDKGVAQQDIRAMWLLSTERSHHLECLQSLEPHFRALLASARSIRESRLALSYSDTHRNPLTPGAPAASAVTSSTASITPQRKSVQNTSTTRSTTETPVHPPTIQLGNSGTATESTNKSKLSMMGPLIASGDAADARGLAELIDKCDDALAAAAAARRDLRHHTVAMTALGVDADVDYARSLLNLTPPNQKSMAHHLRQIESEQHVELQSESSLLNAAAMHINRMGFPRFSSFLSSRRYGSFQHLTNDAFAHQSGPENYRIALRAQCAGAALFSASCYAAVPGIVAVALKLRQPRYFAGLLLAAAPLAALGARYAAEEAKKRFPNIGFKQPVLLGGATCCAGNLLYAFAIVQASSHKWYTKNSMAIATLLARLLVGFSGGSDTLNRIYISSVDMEPAERGAAATRYVAADAIGVAFGLALTAFFSSNQVRYHRHLAAPHFALSIVLALHALLVAFVWREVPQVSRGTTEDRDASHFHGESSNAGSRSSSSVYRGGYKGYGTARGGIEAREMSKSVPPRPPRVVRITSSPRAERIRRSDEVSCGFGSAAYLWTLGRLFASGIVIELIMVSSPRLVELSFGWSKRLIAVVLCTLRLSGLPTRQRAQYAIERVDERCLSLGGAVAALLAVFLLASWPIMLAPEKNSPRQNKVLIWLAAAAVALASAEAMAVADRALVAKLSPLDARNGISANTDLLARIIGDLLFAIVLAAFKPVHQANAALWTIPAIVLVVATVSAASGIDFRLRRRALLRRIGSSRLFE